MRKKVTVGIAITITLILIFGGVVLLRSKSKKKENNVPKPTVETTLPTIDPSIKVDLTARSDGHAVILHISPVPADTTSIDYELTYNTVDGLPRGAIGKIQMVSKNDVTEEILLGTCSTNSCSYDEGVKEVKLVLKFNTSSGSRQFQKNFLL